MGKCRLCYALHILASPASEVFSVLVCDCCATVWLAADLWTDDNDFLYSPHTEQWIWRSYSCGSSRKYVHE